MAQFGPVPARSTALSRERDIERGDRGPITKGEMQPVEIPEPDPNWHPTAKMIYESYSKSGQSFWAQQTDWAMLWFTCSEISNYLTPAMIMEKDEKTRRLVPKTDELGNIMFYPQHKLSAVMFAEINRALSELMFSEGARRRVRIELEQPKEDDGDSEVLYLAQVEEELSSF